MAQEICHRVKVKLAVRIDFESHKGESEGIYSAGPEYANHIQHDDTTGPLTPAALHYQLARRGISVGTVAFHGRQNELDPRMDRLCVFEASGTPQFRPWHVIYEEIHGQFDGRTGEATIAGFRNTKGFRWLFLTFQPRSGASSRETLEPMYERLKHLHLHSEFELTSDIRVFLPRKNGQVCLSALRRLTALIRTYENDLDDLHAPDRSIPFVRMRLDSVLGEASCEICHSQPEDARDGVRAPGRWAVGKIFQAESIRELVELTVPGEEFRKDSPVWVEKYNFGGAALGWITFQQHIASLVPGNILAWAEICACLVRYALNTGSEALLLMLKPELERQGSDEETCTNVLKLLRTIGCPLPAYQRIRRRLVREGIPIPNNEEPEPTVQPHPTDQPEPADEPKPMDLD
jgi:hypothetical protein